MNPLQNLHTHSTYCDGKDTLEEMIAAARRKGFESLGFSGHSYMHYSPGHSMSLEGTEAYKEEIAGLKKKYAGEIELFCGLEVDMYSEIDLSGYDYLIGSVHYLPIGSEKELFFDEDAKEYKRLAVEAAEALAGKIPFFEVNTGAIARGYRTTPYPTVYLMKDGFVPAAL